MLFLDQINRDLSFLGNSKSRAAFDRGYCGLLLKIRGGGFQWNTNKHFNNIGERVIAFFEDLKRFDLPDCDIPINLGDKPIALNKNRQWPVLSQCKREGTYDLLIPCIATHWHPWRNGTHLRYIRNTVSWDKKRPILFWRGVNSGKPERADTWMNNPRCKLCLLSNSTDMIDAAFSSLIEKKIDPIVLPNMESLVGGFVSNDAQFKSYKYILSIDGNSYPSNFVRVLASGSLCFKQDSHHYQFFESCLKPWEHYVPIKNDLSDLMDKLKWAIVNDDKSQEIANNAQKFVKKHMMYDDLLNYIYKLIIAWNAL